VKPGRRGPRLGQTRPSALRLCGRRIGDGEVACLRLPVATRRQTGAMHRQAADRCDLPTGPAGQAGAQARPRAVRRITHGGGHPPGRWSGRGAHGGSALGWGGPCTRETPTRFGRRTKIKPNRKLIARVRSANFMPRYRCPIANKDAVTVMDRHPDLSSRNFCSDPWMAPRAMNSWI